jgi:superfamily II DNA or RNA helicase
VVTGAGKTIFALLCMRDTLTEHPNARFLILVPSFALLDQWLFALTHELGVSIDAVGVLKNGQTVSERATFVVAILNSARSATQAITQTGSWFLCVDECHRAGSPANSAALNGTFIATLGLSATPRRQYDKGFEANVAPRIGEVVFEYSFAAALRDQIVSPFRLENFKVPFTDAEQRKFNQLSRYIAIEFGKGKLTSPRLESLLRQRASVIVNARWRVPAAVAIALRYHKPTIIFHERIAAAEEIANLMQKRGASVVTYHSKLSTGIRRRNLFLFREGIVAYLVTCRSLDEGLDIPEAEIGLVAASARSIRQRVQRLGRVIRRSPDKEEAVVATIYCSDVERRQLESEEIDLDEIVGVSWYEAASLNV